MQVKTINNNNILKTWYLNFAHYSQLIGDIFYFPSLPNAADLRRDDSNLHLQIHAFLYMRY